MKKKVTWPEQFLVARYHCNTAFDGENQRVELTVESTSPEGELTLSLPPVLAEGLAGALLCQCARTKGRALGGTDVAYAADRAKLHYDHVQASGRIDFSARGMHGISIQLSLESLQLLRAALDAIE